MMPGMSRLAAIRAETVPEREDSELRAAIASSYLARVLLAVQRSASSSPPMRASLACVSASLAESACCASLASPSSSRERSTLVACEASSASASASAPEAASCLSTRSCFSLSASCPSALMAASSCACGSRSRCFFSMSLHSGSVCPLRLSYMASSSFSSRATSSELAAMSASIRGTSLESALTSARTSPSTFLSLSAASSSFFFCFFWCLSSSMCLMSSRSNSWKASRLFSSWSDTFACSRLHFLYSFSSTPSCFSLSPSLLCSSASLAASSSRFCSISALYAAARAEFFW
mmetsp:Transcript_2251/g.4681  ORF Transcript_2251/g.4681 Transcript_2251/m.4681 type:complete len:292 (-) Transcript_2251:418-1293(-)